MKARKIFFEQHLEAIGQCGMNNGKRSRLAYTKDENMAFIRAGNLMVAAGMRTSRDAFGNLYGMVGPRGRKVMSGSHLDSVEDAGKFDGVAGVLAAIEAVRMVSESGARLRKPLMAVAWRGEESVRFGKTYLGSGAAFGRCTEKLLARMEVKAFEGGERMTLRQAMRLCGANPSCLRAHLRPEWINSYIELHVEQGRILESEGKRVGIVTSIAGNRRFQIKLHGLGLHTGAARMMDRVGNGDEQGADASFAMARMILWLRELANELNTRQRMDALSDVRMACPVIIQNGGGLTTTMQDIVMKFDFRSVDRRLLELAKSDFVRDAKEICRSEGISCELEDIAGEDPFMLSEGMAERIGDACRDMCVDARIMPSGAGHDAKVPASLGVETGMIFVPSK
ncbi:MAG: hydantoinase/carbamoylase family amidase, partial [Candidatus Peribacteraceae bacterium]|nr:hydantoinase/carbamoylase family amidase [Candidatus Peribacteraceae bacterium]